ncbi:fibronectin-like [Branchiostoma floridae x Branchiostoma japonicum]
MEPPIDMAISDVTDKGFRITWSQSPDPDLYEYRVVVSRLDLTTAVNQTTNQTSLLVLDLSPDSDYVVGVTSMFLSAGWRSQSEAVVIHASTEMSSSTDLRFVEVTESSLGFTWVPPNATVTGYRVMYGQGEATEQLIPSPDPGNRSALIEGLLPGVMYKVDIITIGGYRESAPLVGYNMTGMLPTSAAPPNRTSLMTFFFSLLTSTIPADTTETTRVLGPLDHVEDPLDEDQYPDYDFFDPIKTAAPEGSTYPEEIKQTSTTSPEDSRTTPADQV